MNNMIYFTRAKEKESLWIERKSAADHIKPLSGEEARDFYVNLPQQNKSKKTEKQQTTTRKTRRQQAGSNRRRRLEARAPVSGTTDRDGHKLLRFAQEGNTQDLRDLLKRGCDVNFHDDFYWTGLMCASQAGRTEVVRLLLQHGASWVGVVDSQGRDARVLARNAGHLDVVRVLEEFSVSEVQIVTNRNSEDSAEPQWCTACSVHHTDAAETHRRSTLHQFSEHRSPPVPHYCLPSHSTSFKMMTRLGWDPSSGLGPTHSGRKNPVSTVLKRDQKGLGYGESLQARVTHFQAKDPRAVQQMRKEKRLRQQSETKLSAKELQQKEERQRLWERDFRASFNVDL